MKDTFFFENLLLYTISRSYRM